MSLETALMDASPRLSVDSATLNDDLANVSDYLSSVVLQVGQPRHQRLGLAVSFRTSMDAESSFLLSAHFNILNADAHGFLPLGPNSIFELTVALDTARAKRNRAPRTSVTVNGGTSVGSLRTPTTRDIPQIQLLKLRQRVSAAQLDAKLVDGLVDDYHSFESSYKRLTEDTLHQFTRAAGNGPVSASSSVSNADFGPEIDDPVPAVFQDPNFRLDDPRVFKQVLAGAHLDGSSLLHKSDLQEKLSHYLDVVEVQLIHEISKSLDSFFSTLGAIREVQDLSKQCLERFQAIMQKLDVLEALLAQRGSDILNKVREKKNVELLEAALLQIQYVVAIFELAKKSFLNGKHNKCLNEIIIVQNLMRGEPPDLVPEEDSYGIYPVLDGPLSDISLLPALLVLRADLEDLKKECSRGYIDDFVDLLLEDLREHCSSVSSTDTLNRIYLSIDASRKYTSANVNKTYQYVSDDKKERLKDFIANLAKSGHLSHAYHKYQDSVITEIKDIIKIHLPSNSQGLALVDMSNAPSRSSSAPPESAPGNPTSSLSSNIRALSPREYEDMMVAIFSNLSECLRRLTAHQKVLLDLALTVLPPTSEVDVMSLDISLAINKAIEMTQVRLMKVVNVRLEQIADLTVPFYFRLYAITSGYLQECEFINPGYMATGAGRSLNDWVKNHVGYFVHRFHLNAMKRVASDCDKEVWEQVSQPEVLAENQQILDEILGYAEYMESNGASGFNGEPWLDVLDFYESDSKPQRPLPVSRHSLEPSGRLIIGNERFVVPSLILKVVKQTKDYLMIAKLFANHISTLSTNILSLFKLLNSKASQAILNAGATRTAGLRNITTKHLALCIQLVEFNIAFLSNIQHVFVNVPSNASNQPNEDLTFNRITSNYKDHENALFAKLVSIMYDRTVNHCATIVEIDWSQPIKHPDQCHPYMATLVRETSIVTKVLSRYLPEIVSSLILLQIFDNYKKMFVECFCTKIPQFKDFNEKQTLLRDIDYFRAKLCDLPGYGNSGQVIWENVNALPTIEDAKMEEVMRNNIEGERKQISSTKNSAKSSVKNSLDIKRDEQKVAPPVPAKDEPVVVIKEPKEAETALGKLTENPASLEKNSQAVDQENGVAEVKAHGASESFEDVAKTDSVVPADSSAKESTEGQPEGSTKESEDEIKEPLKGASSEEQKNKSENPPFFEGTENKHENDEEVSKAESTPISHEDEKVVLVSDLLIKKEPEKRASENGVSDAAVSSLDGQSGSEKQDGGVKKDENKANEQKLAEGGGAKTKKEKKKKNRTKKQNAVSKDKANETKKHGEDIDDGSSGPSESKSGEQVPDETSEREILFETE